MKTKQSDDEEWDKELAGVLAAGPDTVMREPSRTHLTPLPCSTPCPKCGSQDVRRKWHPKGENWSHSMTKAYPRDNEYVTITKWEGKAKREHIENQCRVCTYEFETEVSNVKVSRRDMAAEE